MRRLIVEEMNKVLSSYDVIIANAAPSIAPYSDASEDEHLSKDITVAENHMVMETSLEIKYDAAMWICGRYANCGKISVQKHLMNRQCLISQKQLKKKQD